MTAFIAAVHRAVHRGDPDAVTHVKIPNEMTVQGSRGKSNRPQKISRHWQGIDRWALAQLLDLHGTDTRPAPPAEGYSFLWRYPGMAYDLQRSLDPSKPIYDSEWHGVQTVFYQNGDLPGAYLNAALWFSYLHGMDANMMWWWSRSGTEPEAKWFEGSLLTQPQLLDAFGRNSIEVQRHAGLITAFQDDVPRVRLLFSKPSAILDLNYLDTQEAVYEACAWLGVTLGFVTEEMLLGGASDFDLLLVPGARHGSPGVREAVSRLAGSGVTVGFVGEACLTLDPHGTPLSDAVPVEARELDGGEEQLSALLGEAGLERRVRFVGPDGRTSRPVECRAVRHEGRWYGAMIGLNTEPAAIRVLLGGSPAHCKSVLTGDEFSGSIRVEPWDVHLFEIRSTGPSGDRAR